MFRLSWFSWQNGLVIKLLSERLHLVLWQVCDNIVQRAGDLKLSRRLIDRKRLEMRLATLYLCTLLSPEIILGEQSALCFNNEVKALALISLDKNSPVRVVAAQRRRDLEPAGQFCVDFHCFVIFQLGREGTF